MRIGVIGAGVVGALIARELCRYDVEVHLFEREADVSFGVSKANSGVIHGCFHEQPGTIRARLCVKGNALYERLSRELDFPLDRIGAHVIAFNRVDEETLEQLRAQGEEIRVPGLEIINRDELLAREPRVSPDARAALWSPTVGIVDPWDIAIAAVENAHDNGLHLHLQTEVTGIRVDSGHVRGVVTKCGEFQLDAVVNAAGLFADRVTQMAGLEPMVIHPRRGEYILLDREKEQPANSVLFPTPTPTSKGILVLPTIDGNTLLGPTALDIPELNESATITSRDGLKKVIAGARRLVPSLDFGLTIKTFAGARPEPEGGEFVIGATAVRGFYQAAGMCSPGLTAAPAVADYLAREIASDLGLTRNPAFNPIRRAIPRFSELTADARDALIRKEPRYGRIICRCNEVTEGEIVEAIRRGARTIDGIKFRTHAGFGRCQGGFCTARIIAILSRELKIPPEEVAVRRPEDRIAVGRVRP